MNVFAMTLSICVVFGAVTFWYGVMRRSRMRAHAGRRETFRMAVAMCVSAAFASLLMFIGIHWTIAVLMTAVFVFLMTPLYVRLVRHMEGIDTR